MQNAPNPWERIRACVRRLRSPSDALFNAGHNHDKEIIEDEIEELETALIAVSTDLLTSTTGLLGLDNKPENKASKISFLDLIEREIKKRKDDGNSTNP